MPPKWWTLPNPMVDYTEGKLYEFLSSYVPEYEPGTRYEYANLGFGLFGVALARRAGKSYEELLIERVCNPLGLSHTRITLSADMRRHLVQPHDLELKPTPPGICRRWPEGVRSAPTPRISPCFSRHAWG